MIFDIGANNGNDSDFYLKKGFRVVAVEANPILANGLASRFSNEIASGDMHVVNMGVALDEDRLPFYVSLVNSEQSSFDRSFAQRLGPFDVVDVPVVNARALFSAFGVPYYVKIDIEGMDLLVLDAILDLDVKPKYLSFECGPIGWSNYIEKLAVAGYSKFKISNQSIVSKVTIPIPSSEGKSIDYKFLPGSSGPFGEDLEGDWMSSEAMLAEFQAVSSDEVNIQGVWWDVHASQ